MEYNNYPGSINVSIRSRGNNFPLLICRFRETSPPPKIKFNERSVIREIC